MSYSRSLILLSTLTLAACSEPTTQAPDTTPLQVISQPLAELAVDIEYSAPATALSQDESTLSAEISARIDAIVARVGDQVEKGDVLVKLDCTDISAQLRQSQAQAQAARARAEMAKQQLERAEALAKKRSISRELLSQRQAEADIAKADLQASTAASDIANNRRQRCQLRAPFKAVVTQRTGQVGEIAALGAPMMTLVSLEGLEVSADIIPSDAYALEHNDAIIFRTEAADYPVSLRALTAAIGSLTKTREARLSFKESPPLPGTPGRLIWKDSRPGIPAHLLTERSGQLGIMINQSGVASFTPLPQAQDGRATATDISQDTLIITTGRTRVKDGDKLPDSRS